MFAELINGPASPPLVLFTRLALALGSGVFVDLERERRGKSGARTFALVCAMTGVGGSLGDGYSWAVLGIVDVLVVLLNLRPLARQQDVELTTSTALFVVAFVGILIGRGYTFVPVALAVVTAAPSAWKQSLHDLAGGLSESEIRSAIMLALLALVMIPLLPEEPVDRWSLVHPRAAGVAVVVLAALGWANCLLWRIYGARGMSAARLLGNLVDHDLPDSINSQREGARMVYRVWPACMHRQRTGRIECLVGEQHSQSSAAFLAFEEILNLAAAPRSSG